VHVFEATKDVTDIAKSGFQSLVIGDPIPVRGDSHTISSDSFRIW